VRGRANNNDVVDGMDGHTYQSPCGSVREEGALFPAAAEANVGAMLPGGNGCRIGKFRADESGRCEVQKVRV
jgi:hypothetical protein